VVKFAILSEIFMDLLPTYFGFFFNLIAGVSAVQYVGDYINLPMNLEAAACGLYYWRMFRRNPIAAAGGFRARIAGGQSSHLAIQRNNNKNAKVANLPKQQQKKKDGDEAVIN
jgi:hypothetical protein